MSRSNPFKRKPRYVKDVILVVVEGKREYIFITFLKSLFARDIGKILKIKNAYGGGATNMVKYMKRIPGQYYLQVLILDDDNDSIKKNEIRKLQEVYTKDKILIISNTPCLEALLLCIFDGNDYSSLSSINCKVKFEKKFKIKSERDFMKFLKKRRKALKLKGTRKRCAVYDYILRKLFN